MKPVTFAVLASLVLPSFAHAQGINLSWDACGSAGSSVANWACDGESGAPFVLVASFLPPPGIEELFGLAAQVDISAGKSLPDWWKHGISFCRGGGALVHVLDGTGITGCTDYMAGSWAGGIA